MTWASASAVSRCWTGGIAPSSSVLQRPHDLHVDHAGLAVEHAPDPDLAVDIHAGGQAVAPVGGVLQRDRIHRPFQDEEADRQNIDQIGTHVSSPVVDACHAWSVATTGTMAAGELNSQ